MLEAAGKKVLLLIWDNASWHVSKEVRRWLGRHNREVKKSGGEAGVTAGCSGIGPCCFPGRMDASLEGLGGRCDPLKKCAIPKTRPTGSTSLQPAVRIVSCLLPKQSPWLNAIEPKWMHGKRKVVEPEGLLDAYELAERVCRAFGCAHYEHLSIPREVA